jgi:hypothetical protein
MLLKFCQQRPNQLIRNGSGTSAAQDAKTGAVDAQSTPQAVWVRGERITLELGQVGWSIAVLAEE